MSRSPELAKLLRTYLETSRDAGWTRIRHALSNSFLVASQLLTRIKLLNQSGFNLR